MPALVASDGTTPLRQAAFGESRWPGASRRRGFSDWLPSAGSADSDNNPEIDINARRGRDIDRSEGVVYGAISNQVEAINGVGLQVIPTPDWVTLGKSKAWADGWARIVRNKHRNWSTTSDCDASRTESLGFMAAELLTSTIVTGSGVAVPFYLPDNGQTEYGTCYRIVEADRLSNPNFGPDRDDLRRGIHIDPETGAPLGYWLCTRHPGDALGFLAAGVKREWIYIPAFTPWGRRRLIHVFSTAWMARVEGDDRDVPGGWAEGKVVSLSVKDSSAPGAFPRATIRIASSDGTGLAGGVEGLSCAYTDQDWDRISLAAFNGYGVPADPVAGCQASVENNVAQELGFVNANDYRRGIAGRNDQSKNDPKALLRQALTKFHFAMSPISGQPSLQGFIPILASAWQGPRQCNLPSLDQ